MVYFWSRLIWQARQVMLFFISIRCGLKLAIVFFSGRVRFLCELGHFRANFSREIRWPINRHEWFFSCGKRLFIPSSIHSKSAKVRIILLFLAHMDNRSRVRIVVDWAGLSNGV